MRLNAICFDDYQLSVFEYQTGSAEDKGDDAWAKHFEHRSDWVICICIAPIFESHSE